MNTYSGTLMQERTNAHSNGGQRLEERVRPITVALVNDYEIILRGLHAMLAPFSDRIEVVEHDTTGTPDKPADVALFDTFASRRDALERAREMIAEGNVKHVVLYTFDAAEEFLTIARDIGVSGVVLKSATGSKSSSTRPGELLTSEPTSRCSTPLPAGATPWNALAR